MIDVPVRPAYDPKMSEKKRQRREEKAFAKWLDAIFTQYEDRRLNRFEQNLGVWRELWRCCEVGGDGRGGRASAGAALTPASRAALRS